MADSDTISGIENLKSAVSGETPAYQYKDPNTDMMKAISKCIDAADGTIDEQYEYKNPNTDVIRKMDELATAIASSGGGGSGATLRLHEGYLNIRTGAISADSNYYYSDPFPCPMATTFFDIGESSKNSTLGFAIYDPNGTYTEYFSANERHRTVNITEYVPDPTGHTCRLSFAKSHLTDLLFRDISANILYASADFVTITE